MKKGLMSNIKNSLNRLFKSFDDQVSVTRTSFETFHVTAVH